MGSETNTAPGILSLQAGDGDYIYFWVDNSGNLRTHTSVPTNSNTDGSLVASQT